MNEHKSTTTITTKHKLNKNVCLIQIYFSVTVKTVLQFLLLISSTFVWQDEILPFITADMFWNVA